VKAASCSSFCLLYSISLKIEDYELFTEYEANMKAAQKNLDAAQAKFEITDGKFEIEKAIKETRDL
jgi:hypothetical protein